MECNHPKIKVWTEVSDVYSHSLRTMDAISPSKPLLRLAALLHDIGKVPTKAEGVDATKEVSFLMHESIGADMAEEICKRLNMSNDDTKFVTTVIAQHMHFIDDSTKLKSVKKWIVNNPFYKDNLRLRIADRRANLTKINKPIATQKLKQLIRMIKEVEKFKPPMRVTDLVINGHDLIDMGLTPSPLFSKILNMLVEEVLEDPSKNTREYLLN